MKALVFGPLSPQNPVRRMFVTARSDNLLDLAGFETARANVHPTCYTVDKDSRLVNVGQPAPFCHPGDMLADPTGFLSLTAPHDLVPDTRTFSAYVASSRHFRFLSHVIKKTAQQR